MDEDLLGLAMGATSNPTWNTKYGGRRVRHDPPTLQEAMAAAQGLTDELHEQIELAASLMDLPVDDVRAEVMKTMAPMRKTVQTVTPSGRAGATGRTVVVERRTRRAAAPRP
jgi:hypothetical protein